MGNNISLMMRYSFFLIYLTSYFIAIFSWGVAFAESPTSKTKCFESREEYSKVEKVEIDKGLVNVKCSDATSGVLWWGDPFYDTKEMGDMPIEADYTHGEAVVRSRIKQLHYYMPCSVCHNGISVPFPKDKTPRLLRFHKDIVPDSLNLQHGKGAIWCLDCHNAQNRDTLITHTGEEISFNQPQRLCGKCHGQIFRDWREGIHGKRIGMWAKDGKKRWWVCTECHNPHKMEPPFKQLTPEPAPVIPPGAPLEIHGETGH